MANNIDKLVQAINDFKKSLNGQTISIHGKDYATVALRVGILRRNLGSALDIISKIISIDKETVVMQADIYIDGITRGDKRSFKDKDYKKRLKDWMKLKL